MSKLYEDFNYPSWYRDYIQKNSRETSQETYWLSQSRSGDSDVEEILRVVFKKPVSISQFSVKLLRHNCHASFFYTDRRNKRLPLLSRSHQHLQRQITSSSENLNPKEEESWVRVEDQTYPVVAKKFEIVIKRTSSSSSSYNVGIKDLEIKRNLYIQDDTMLPIGDETDALGNYVSKTVKNWDAVKAIDSDAFSFWKSEPMPDKNAVVSFFLDVRDEEGNGQLIDRLWLDPVYSGQRMNIYYSTDETIGTRKLKPSVYPPLGSQDVIWKSGEGLRFLPGGAQEYDLSSLNLKTEESFWIGGTWKPAYNSDDDTVTTQSVLFQESKNTSLSFLFNYGSSSFFLLGRTPEGDPVQITSPKVNFFRGSEIVWALYYIRPDNERSKGTWGFVAQDANNYFSQTVETDDLSIDVETGGSFGIDIEGYLTSYIIKQSNFYSDREKWLSSPEIYLTPDPVIEDRQGRLPSTTLDNAVFGGDFRLRELPFGGLDEFFFESKVWSPIWRDWTVQRSFYFFPRPVYAKYLKLELTSLTEEPYPIYETGIDVKYKVYPVTVSKAVERTIHEVWSNVAYYNARGEKVGYRTELARTVDIIENLSLSVGKGTITSIPKQYEMPIEMSFRSEGTKFYGMMKATAVTSGGRSKNTAVELTNYRKTPNWYEGFSSPFALDWDRLLKDNPSLFGQKAWVDNSGSVTLPTVPKPINGHYQLPGGLVTVPALYNDLITTRASITTRQLKTFTHSRFTTNSVHRYKIKSARRTEQTGFFAGLRDVKAFKVDYRKAVDTESYFVERYNPDDFEVAENIEFYPETGASLVKEWLKPRLYTSAVNLWKQPLLSKRNDSIDALSSRLTVRDGLEATLTREDIDSNNLSFFSAKDSYSIEVHPKKPYSFRLPLKNTGVVDVHLDIEILLTSGDGKVSNTSTEAVLRAGASEDLLIERFVPTRSGRVVFSIKASRENTPQEGSRLVLRDGITITETEEVVESFSGSSEESPESYYTWSGEVNNSTSTWYEKRFPEESVGERKPGILETEVFESQSFWQRLELDSVCRPPREIFDDKLDYEPLTEGDVQGGSWEDPKAKWSDRVVAWDADHPFVGINVSYPSLFSGKMSIKVTRPSGFGFAGLKTTPFPLKMNERIRVRAELYKTRASKNDVVLQLYDTVSNTIIYTDKVQATTGRWNKVYTNFFIPKTDYSSVVARFVIRGEETEEVYIAGFTPEITTIVFHASNDGGRTWYDVTNIVNLDDHYYVFPKPGRQFKLRVSMTDKNDHIFGFEARPTYLANIKE